MSSTKRSLLLLSVLLIVLSAGCDEKPSQPALTQSISNTLGIRAEKTVEDIPLLDQRTQLLADSNSTLLTIDPELPGGLVFDSVTGRVSGTPATNAAPVVYKISINGTDESEEHLVSLSIDKQLPPQLNTLAVGFNAEALLTDANLPVRMALAPDGRLFYAELQSGFIRIIEPNSGLLTKPFVSVPVLAGAEKGLLGLALDPEFENNGLVYVHATVSGNDVLPDRAQIIRYTAVGNAGVNPTVIVDNLPIADIHNGGDLVFDHSGNLFIGRGDITDPASAQRSGDRSGKVLRYTPDGGIPSDNPYPGDPEWSRGLRNTFPLAVHPLTGDLFGADAGPTSDDKLNFLKPGKNFQWGMEQEPQGGNIGFSVRIWPEVITPTSLLFHSGKGGFDIYSNQLFVSSYNFEDIRIIYLDGDAFTDFIREETFATFNSDSFDNKPLHMLEAANGDLYVSTFDAIYRIYQTDKS